MTHVQNYRQIKNKGSLEFLKNNQLCSIKSTKKNDGKIPLKKRYKKTDRKKWNK